MWYVGLDLHWRTSTVCILNENGKKVKTMTIRGVWDKVFAALAELPEPWAVCFEASCGYGAAYERLRPMARRVVVAHPGQLRLIFRAKRKNDRVDAKKLATLLYLDAVPPVHVPDLDVRSWRQLIEFRKRLVDKRTRCKNGLRSLLRSHGLRAPRGLWTRKGLAWLEALPMPTSAATCQRDMLLEELAQFQEKVARVTRELDTMGRAHPAVGLLQTIPGVGPRTAEAMVAYLDDPKRFDNARQVGAYFGLVPCEDASAGAHRLGHITKEGPATARKYLVEATWQVIRLCPAARERFDRVTAGKRDRRKIALVATAHWVARCMFGMLRTGTPWRPAA
jgi:transposase